MKNEFLSLTFWVILTYFSQTFVVFHLKKDQSVTDRVSQQTLIKTKERQVWQPALVDITKSSQHWWFYLYLDFSNLINPNQSFFFTQPDLCHIVKLLLSYIGITHIPSSHPSMSITLFSASVTGKSDAMCIIYVEPLIIFAQSFLTFCQIRQLKVFEAEIGLCCQSVTNGEL